VIGWISDDGLWLTRGDEAQRLQVGAAVLAWRTPDGELIKADGAQVKTELGWAGPETLGIELDPAIIDRVLYPLGGMLLPNGEAPATSRTEFERALAQGAGAPPDVTVGRASCECGSPVEEALAQVRGSLAQLAESGFTDPRHPAIGA
jgi:hypothetical protein